MSASLGKLSPGDTLYVRGGTYFESPTASVSGTESAPIVVRSFPGERGIIDSSHPEFQTVGNSEWVLVDALNGEYRSKRKYSKSTIYGYVACVPGYENERVALVPYEAASHFRSTTDQYNPTAFYVGPGTYRETSGYIHIRLAKTSDLRATEARYGTVFATENPNPANYSLILSQASYTLQITGAHWIFMDLTFNQAKRTIALAGGSHHIRLEGLTVWAGNRAISAAGPDVHHITLTRSRIYGDHPYWVFWSDMKDAPAPANALRGTSIDLRYGAHDWEISFNHIRGSAQDLIGLAENEYNIDIHHNRIENCGDDAMEIEGDIDVGRVSIYENYIANALVAIAPGQSTPAFTGPLLVYRNVIALLRNPPVNRAQGINGWNGGFRYGHEYMFKHGTGTGDNSRNAHYYHNTLVMLGSHRHGLNITPRYPEGTRLANNLMMVVNGVVNNSYRTGAGQVVNGNLYWKMNTVDTETLLGGYDNVPAFSAATGLEANGIGSIPKRGTNPQFSNLPLEMVTTSTKWGLTAASERLGPADFLLTSSSPARGAGIAIPPHATLGTLPDTRSSTDIGAIPFGTEASAFAYFPFDPNGPFTPPPGDPPGDDPPVDDRPTNTAPSVDAGPDREVTLPGEAFLDGTVSDDGLPDPPGRLSITWSLSSGPVAPMFADASSVDTQVGFSQAGTYVLRLTASDGVLVSSDTMTVVVHPAPPGPSVIQSRVSQSTDDAEEGRRGKMTLGSGDLKIVVSGNFAQTVGLRFSNLAIPRGATVTRAYVQFTVHDASSGAASLSIRGQTSDNATTFTRDNDNIALRPTSATAVLWSPPAWTASGLATEAQRTPDLSAIIQEIVNRPGWSSGNALALLISGSGTRSARSFDGDPTKAPLLYIELAPAAARSAGSSRSAPELGLPAQVTPNPLRRDGYLRFSTAQPGSVWVELFDVRGRLVARPLDIAMLPAGNHQIALDGRGESGKRLDAGVYFYRIHKPEGTTSGRFLIAR